MEAKSEIRDEPPTPLHRGRTVGIVTILTLVVSGFGYIREAVLAGHFGVSATMDAYFGAIFVPSNIYLILVVGTLSPVFIPLILQSDGAHDPARLSEIVSVVANFVFVVLVGFVSVGLLTIRYWLPALFPGFDVATIAMATQLTYIILPAVVFLGLAGIITAVLNAFHRFALPALAPALSSIVVIAAVLMAHGKRAVVVVGLATTVGFLLQFLALLPAVVALRIRYVPVFNFRHPAIAKLLRLGGPLLLYLVVCSASSVVERNLASRLSTGAVSAVTYAIRLFAVPSNFLAAPLALVSYPLFAREAAREDHGDLRDQLSRSLRFVVFLFVPVTLWVILNALPLTRVVYERGHFRPEDSFVIAKILSLYAIGILPNAVGIVLLRCFYALQDTITPLVLELINLVVYTALATWLTNHFGIGGLAVTRGLSFFVVAFVFVFVLRYKRAVLTIDRDMLSLCFKTAIASLAMGIVSWRTAHLLQEVFNAGSTPLRLLVVGVVLVASAVTFLGTASLLKLGEAKSLINLGLALIPGYRESDLG